MACILLGIYFDFGTARHSVHGVIDADEDSTKGPFGVVFFGQNLQ